MLRQLSTRGAGSALIVAALWACSQGEGSEPTPGAGVPAFDGTLGSNTGAATGAPSGTAASPGVAAGVSGGGALGNGSEAPSATDLQGGSATQGAGTAAPPSSAVDPNTTDDTMAPPAEGAMGAPSPTDPAAPEPGAPPGSVASPGCGRATGDSAAPAVPNTLLFLPPSYDGVTPVPLVFAFHGAGRTNQDMREIDSRTNGSVLEQSYVMAYMKSAGNAWDLGADYPRFEAVLEQLSNELCIDTAHVFAFGHSSGAQFIAQMLGDGRARETRLAAIAPVASSDFGNPNWEPVPTLLIHGLNDTQRPNDRDGAADITQYRDSNQCSTTTEPLALPSCPSFADEVPVDPGCVRYVGCAAPTLFCQHDDPNYVENGSPTNHGWPCFATQQIFEFFEAQR